MSQIIRPTLSVTPFRHIQPSVIMQASNKSKSPSMPSSTGTYSPLNYLALIARGVGVVRHLGDSLFIENYGISRSAIAVVCHFIRDQILAFCSLLKNNLDSLHRCVHAINRSKLIAGFFSHLIPIDADDVARPVRDAIENDLSFCVIDCLGAIPALNGIPVFVNLDKRERESACRGFTHATIDQLKSKIATAAIKTASFNAMRHTLPFGAAYWQKSALFQLQDHVLARK